MPQSLWQNKHVVQAGLPASCTNSEMQCDNINGVHEAESAASKRRVCTSSLPFDSQLALEQHKAGMLSEALVMLQPQQLSLSQIPGELLVQLLRLLPAHANKLESSLQKRCNPCDAV